VKNRSRSKTIGVDKLNDIGVMQVDDLRDVIESSVRIGNDIAVDDPV